jgi:protein involved in polysaccharide export with SLBB domain
VSASISGATYNDTSVASANQITIVYAISGVDAANYLAPANDTIAATITRAAGATVNAPTVLSKSYNRITVNTITASTGQSVEYAISTSIDETGLTWRNDTVFTGLNAETTYYIYARSVANDNYDEGTASVGTITTLQSGTAEVTSYYWVNERDVLATTGNTGNGAITLSPGDVLTITAQGAPQGGEGYTNQQWYLNGVPTGNTGNTYMFSTTITGKYTVGLFVQKDGKWYNANFAITVTE